MEWVGGLCPYIVCRNVKYTNHRRWRASTPARRGLTDNVGRPFKMVRGLCPRDLHTWGDGRKVGAPWVAGCEWSGRTGAPNAARPSTEGGASGTPPLTGGCET